MAPTLDPRRADEATINLFHPVYHCHTYPVGCRVDIERVLPPTLDEFDAEELVDNFSEPPVWVERFSPLAVQVGDQIYRGKNYADLMLKIYRLMFDLFQGIGRFIDSTMTQSAEGETPIRFPFMSLCVDPDTMHRLIESDFESGETTYSNLMKLYSDGTLTPCLTTPFHAILPLLETDAEIRLCVRSGLIFYLRLMRSCNEFLERNGEHGLLVVPFWMPEGGYSERVLNILDEEFQSFCAKNKLGQSHLVVLLDNHQVQYGENDVLMKSWNLIDRPNGHHGNGNGRNGKGAKAARAKEKGKELHLHEGVGSISVVFRDRIFSEWVIHANPSVKKLLDRTIAKVDSDINGQNVHYGWAHYEELEAITYSTRAIVNFQQKLVKLTELGYLPLSPDFYVRGKLRGEFGYTTKEPLMVKPLDPSIGNGWDKENSKCLCRWLGVKENGDGTGKQVSLMPYEQATPEGPVKKVGCGGWKVAWREARDKCYRAVVGNLDTMEGGMAEVLAELTQQDDPEKARRNVEDFLAHYTYVYWREHFIQHDLAEADINIIETGNKYLRAGVKAELEPEEAAIIGAAAQAIFFALDSGRSQGLAYENMDQRAFYQNVTMLTLAMCNAMYVHHWRDDKKAARKLLGLLQTELLDFEGAYERCGLEALGVSKTQWKQCLRPEISESRENVVRRATLRVAARHLRPLGYTKEFSRNDANITTNVGHVWSLETGRENFAYENPLFCGVSEA